jgi:hypothetical protein
MKLLSIALTLVAAAAMTSPATAESEEKCANDRSVIDLEFVEFSQEETAKIDAMCVGDISLIIFNLPIETVAMGRDGLFSITPVGDQKILLSALSEGTTKLIALSTDGEHVVSVNLTVEKEPLVKEPPADILNSQNLTPGAMLFGLSSSELEGPYEFLSAGDSVNVMFNYKTGETDLAYFNSQTILQQIKIYDILQPTGPNERPQTFLLEVNGDESAILERARRNGTISFVRLAPQIRQGDQENMLDIPVAHDILLRVLGKTNANPDLHSQTTSLKDVLDANPQMNEVTSTQNLEPKQIQILQGSRMISYSCAKRCERVLRNE